LERGDDFDARIDRAAEAFEQRITGWVADRIERAFQASPPRKKDDGDR
jgi:hypothetical protein